MSKTQNRLMELSRVMLNHSEKVSRMVEPCDFRARVSADGQSGISGKNEGEDNLP